MNFREKLQKQIDQMSLLQSHSDEDPTFVARRNKTLRLLEKIFWWKQSSGYEDFRYIQFDQQVFSYGEPSNRGFYFQQWLQQAKETLTSYLDEIEDDEGETTKPSPIEKIENIFDKFHRIIKQLELRHDNRETITINDEYDVQDVLHALLKLYFDDIRSEEWNPSYAWWSTRSDFLLKNEKIVIEVKKTRKWLDDKEIGKQLINDIANYKQHPDCDQLICFVYDPDWYIRNPRWLEDDLSNTKDLSVKVFIKQS